jgi:hypothetical protein
MAFIARCGCTLHTLHASNVFGSAQYMPERALHALQFAIFTIALFDGGVVEHALLSMVCTPVTN